MASAPICARETVRQKSFWSSRYFFLGEHLAFLDARNIARIDGRRSLQSTGCVRGSAHGNVQQVADARRQALEEPDVREQGEASFDVAEAFAADLAKA